MPTYLHPGVYVEEIPSGARPIESAGTSTAAIIGFAAKGPKGTPTLIFNWKQYQETFGGIQDYNANTSGSKVDYMGHTVQAFFNNGGGKAYIVRLADGASASTVDLALPGPGGNNVDFEKDYSFIEITGASDGAWADGLVVNLTLADGTKTPKRYNISVGTLNADGEFDALESYLDVTLAAGDADHAANIVNSNSSYIRLKDEAPGTGAFEDSDVEKFMVAEVIGGDISALDGTDLSSENNKKLKITVTGSVDTTISISATANTTISDIAAQIESEVRTNGTGPESTEFQCYYEGGKIIMVAGDQGATSIITLASVPQTALTFLSLSAGTVTGEEALAEMLKRFSQASLAGGNNGSVPVSQTDYDPVFATFKDMRDVNIVLIPDHFYDKANPASKSILDAAKAHCEATKNRMVILDPPSSKKIISESDFKPLGMPSSTYTATYYPWVEVANPHYHPEKRAHLPATYLVPASGFAAGMWAKTDNRRGVWKAPAGLQTGLTGAVRTEYVVGDDAQDQLNPLGVNCLRTILTEPVIWGSRTLATRADPEWRYVPVRRTAMMIEESLYRGIQWAVFEPNDHNLWASLRLNIETFMDGLHRSGAFQGEKSSDAYFVQCGLGSTMTQGDIDAGRVIIEVGFAPLKPAEFVIVRIQQKTAQL